jgi:hypothetical protein
MKWIGVGIWPAETSREIYYGDYFNEVMKSIEYPAQFGEYRYNSKDEIEEPAILSVKVIPDLESILNRADPLAILAWLSRDLRAAEWQRNSEHHGKLTCRPYYTKESSRRVNNTPITSHIGWMLRNNEWLPLAKGGRGRPRDCFFSGRLVESQFPHPIIPSDDSLRSYFMSGRDLQEAWARAGALSGIESMSREEVYLRLLELPSRDPKGLSARSFYRLVLETNDAILGREGPLCSLFKISGRMWGNQDGRKDYFSVRELRHADGEGYPPELLRSLKLVDVPKRSGAEKVESIFGIRPLEKSTIIRSIISYQTASYAELLAKRFEQSKPYLLALRKAQTTQPQYFQSLKAMRLIVCSALKVEITFEGAAFDYFIPNWIGERSGDELYVNTDPQLAFEASLDLIADAIGESIGTMFRLSDGGDFARMFLCEPQGRKPLLRKMLGESSTVDIETILSEIEESTYTSHTFDFPIPGNAFDPTPTTTIVPSQIACAMPEISNAVVEALVVEPFQVTAITHSPSLPTSAIPLRAQQNPSNQPGYHLHAVSDANLAESKAFNFELEQGRFPLLVSGVTGFEGPGCDILSFSDDESRIEFSNATYHDYRLVTRFIEVKGRSDPGARIDLIGNELAAAERFQDRFFIYRLFREDAGVFILSILKNPLIEQDAIETVIRISLDRAQGTERYRLTGG